MSPQYVNFTLVDDNFPESVVDCNDWVEKFCNVLQSFPSHAFNRSIIIAEKNMHSLSFLWASAYLNIPYVPCDPQSPLVRIETIVKQVEPFFYFIQKSIVPRKSILVQSLKVVWESNKFLIGCTHQHSTIPHPQELNFILYTSGSTGIPKGVMISKQNKSCFVDWATQQFKIQKNSHILSVAPFHFDLSVFDLYASQKAGCTLFLPMQNGIMNPLYLTEFISIYKINTIYATPTWFKLLIRFGKPKRFDFSFVTTILLAGEALELALVHDLESIFPNAVLSNLYGPTETNVCSYYTLQPNNIEHQNGVVSIGQACPYATLSVSQQNILEVAGQSVMLGYWPELFTPQKYSTGDVVQFNNNSGNYFYMGRADRMFKRNGFRIEPAEIELLVSTYPAISQVAVTTQNSMEGVKIVVHYSANEPIETNDLSRFCLDRLPSYMQPDKFLVHSQLPMTTSGKINYKLLSEIE